MRKHTQSLSSHGKEYFENAAKQIRWPVEVGQKKDDYKGVIHVPHYDLEKANDDMMVCHLLKHGFVIQQTIAPISETKIFDPSIRLKDARPVLKQQGDNEFGVGKRFKIKSDGTRLEIIGSAKDSLELKYIDGQKLPIKTTVQHVEKSLRMDVWIRLES